MYHRKKGASAHKMENDSSKPGYLGCGGATGANFEYPGWKKSALCCNLKGGRQASRSPGLSPNYGNVGNDYEMVSDRTARKHK